MSIESLESEIATLTKRFDKLNGNRFDHQTPYRAFSQTREAAIGQLADQIYRLHMTRNVMVAEALNCPPQLPQ
jgi:hypothetical protein